MPYRVFDTDQAAKYLHLPRTDVEHLAKDGVLPSELRGGRRVFHVRDLDAWASQRILGLSGSRLASYHQQSSQGTRGVLSEEVLMPTMIRPAGIDARLAAKTKASVLREMAALAERTGWVSDLRELVTGLEAREQLCSTAVPGGVAFLHTRQHEPYLFETSFIVLGRTVQGIHFGAPDGHPSDLFFLICPQDDRLHLHTLARLCLMGQKTGLLARLRQAPDAAAMHECLVAAEQTVLSANKR
jgi:excisionase family DNA binding protein